MVHRVVGVQLEMCEVTVEVLVVVVKKLISLVMDVFNAILYLLGFRHRPLILLL